MKQQYQHPDDEFGIDIWTAEVALEVPQRVPQSVRFEEQIDLWQYVVGRDVPLKIEVVEKLCLSLLPAHHPEILPSPHSRVNR